MSIRLQLLIVALSTLVLPWAGWQYARELDTALRESQGKSLLASAGTIANALSAQPQRVFRGADLRSFDARAGDLYVHSLRNQPLLDGYREDWGAAMELASLPSVSGYHARLQAGSTERYLFLYLEVDDAHVVAEPNEVRPDQDRFTRVELTVQAAVSENIRYFFGTAAPGLTAAQHWAKNQDAPGETPDHVASETRIQAYWLQTSQGYHLEARLPLELAGAKLWVQAFDGFGKASAGYAPQDNPQGGRLFFTSEGLDGLLDTFVRAGTLATVVDVNGFRLGSAGALSSKTARSVEGGGNSWYRDLMNIDTSNLPVVADANERSFGNSVRTALGGEPRAEWVRGAESQLLLTAAAPIVVEGRVRGAVLLQQNADQLLDLRDDALSRLFNLTLLATAAAVAIMLLFATWISMRIARLRDAADGAVSADGRIRLDMPESASGDEIGALSRGFERLLSRLNEHTHYLRTLGGKLSHELRTPLTIVRSSLDNLESEELREDQRRYVTRAREGTQRLGTILTSLGAAARVEESIQQAERVQFDLRELASAAAAGYRDAFPSTRFALALPHDPCFVRGAPDLIVQLLDKLVENAADFCPAAGAVSLGLSREQSNYVLAVGNDGPRIQGPVLDRLFESLYEQRQGRDDRPHFGLGLYIVRLVAEFHGGRARAANREDGSGVIFTVTLPMI